MKYKMKGFSGFKNESPAKAKTNYTKANDYSAEATKGTVGDKIAKAVTPKSMMDVIPVGKLVKGAKALYNYAKS